LNMLCVQTDCAGSAHSSGTPIRLKRFAYALRTYVLGWTIEAFGDPAIGDVPGVGVVGGCC